MLTSPHLVVFKISVGRDQQNMSDSKKAGSLWGMMRGVGGVSKSKEIPWEEVSTRLNDRKPNSVFSKSSILITISSGHDVIHTPALFHVWDFIMTNGDCHILSARA